MFFAILFVTPTLQQSLLLVSLFFMQDKLSQSTLIHTKNRRLFATTHTSELSSHLLTISLLMLRTQLSPSHSHSVCCTVVHHQLCTAVCVTLLFLFTHTRTHSHAHSLRSRLTSEKVNQGLLYNDDDGERRTATFSGPLLDHFRRTKVANLIHGGRAGHTLDTPKTGLRG